MSEVQVLGFAALAAMAQQAAEAGVLKDMSVATAGGYNLLPEGNALARLVEYIELGSHNQVFKGTSKGSQPEMRLGFALYGKGYQSEDGTPAIIRTYDTVMGTNEKSKAFKLFKKMNYTGQKKSFAQMLGDAFILKVAHTKPAKAGDTPRHYIDFDGMLPPFDPVTASPYPVPMPDDSFFKLFLWAQPNKQCWDSLFIDGVFEDGDKKGKSKNYIQNKILSSTNFKGSALEAMLLSLNLPTLVVDAATDEVEGAEAAQDAAPAIPTAPVAGSIPVAPVSAAAPVVAPVAQTPVTPVVDTPPFVPDVPVAPVVAAPVAAPVVAPTVPAAVAVPQVAVVPAAVVAAPVVAPAIPTIPAVPTVPVVPAV